MGALMNFGDKFNKAEVDDIFGEFEVDDDGFIASKDVIGLFVAGGGEEKKVDATLTTWSRCSKRRWLVAPTTPMTSSSVLSRHTRSTAKSSLRCSVMLS